MIFISGYSQTHHFKNITTEEGLPSSECYKIIQDKKGYMWIATDAGLCKYNGKEFKTFTITDGLPSNTIFEIMEDKYGRIWGGCFHGGVFYVFNDSVYTINANEDLVKRSNKNKEMIRKLILDSENILHVGTTQNYYQIYPQNGYSKIVEYPKVDTSFTFLKIIEDDLLFARIISRKSRIPIYTRHVIETDAKKYTVFPEYPLQISRFPHYHSIKNLDGNIMFTLGNTCYQFNYYTLLRTEFKQSIINLFQDHNKNLWIGFFKQGYLMFPKSDLNSQPIAGLEENAIGGFCHDREGGMWVASLDKGVFYSPNLHILSFKELEGKNIPAVSSTQNQLLVGSSEHQVWNLNENHLELEFELKEGIQSERIFFSEIDGNMYKTGGRSVSFDEHGNYKFMQSLSGSFIGNIVQLTQSEDSILGINQETISVIKNNQIMSEHPLPSRGFCIYHTQRKELLVGCMNGLYQYINGKFKRIYLLEQTENIRISYITEDIYGNVILSTKSHGVFIRKDRTWINITQANGLASNLCNHVYCSKEGIYYVSTNKGLSIIRPLRKISIENINISNGLLANEINMVAEHDEKIYVATEGGLCYFDKTSQVFNYTFPQVISTQISLSNKKLVNSKIYPYYVNDLNFSCDVLSYQSPRLNRIKYQLLPTEKSPRYSSTTNVNYDNLSPGKYTLVIQGVNNNGVEGPATIYSFTISSPFWIRWWFVIIAGIFLGLLVYFLVRKRISYIRKRESEKTALKEKIVEFHYTALRAQMNPHFIFNVINSIQLYVLKNQPKEAYNYLSKFSKLIRRVLENSKQKLITISDELETVRIYMELETIRLEGNITFNIQVDPSISQEEVLLPSMIIQPILENCIWHGIVPLNASRSGKVNIAISIQNNSLLIVIRDNGIGIDPAKKVDQERKSFGLTLIRDRLSLLSGESSIEIANLLNSQNEIQGVEVTLILPLILNTKHDEGRNY